MTGASACSGPGAGAFVAAGRPSLASPSASPAPRRRSSVAISSCPVRDGSSWRWIIASRRSAPRSSASAMSWFGIKAPERTLPATFSRTCARAVTCVRPRKLEDPLMECRARNRRLTVSESASPRSRARISSSTVARCSMASAMNSFIMDGSMAKPAPLHRRYHCAPIKSPSPAEPGRGCGPVSWPGTAARPPC